MRSLDALPNDKAGFDEIHVGVVAGRTLQLQRGAKNMAITYIEKLGTHHGPFAALANYKLSRIT
jgi:hypothetical protein